MAWLCRQRARHLVMANDSIVLFFLLLPGEFLCGEFSLGGDLVRPGPGGAQQPAHVAGQALRQHTRSPEPALEVGAAAAAQVRVLLVTMLELPRRRQAHTLGDALVGLMLISHLILGSYVRRST